MDISKQDSILLALVKLFIKFLRGIMLMNTSTIFRERFTIHNLLLVTVLICSSLAFNQASTAQVMPPIECVVLDDFRNTTLPGNTLSLVNTAPEAVNVLDDGSPGVLGGIRNITYGPLRGTPGFFADSTLAINVIPQNSLSNSNGPDSMTQFSILYNANGAGLNLDLSDTISISFVVALNDQPNTSATIIIADSNNNSAESTIENLPSSNGGGILPADIDFILSEFSGIDGVDLSDIQSIEFRSNPTLGGSDIGFLALEICTPLTRPAIVPTLSEWGLIAMAGVLGIVSLMVMRRRTVSAGI